MESTDRRINFDTPKVYLDQVLGYCYKHAVKTDDYKMMLEVAKIMSDNGLKELQVTEV